MLIRASDANDMVGPWAGTTETPPEGSIYVKANGVGRLVGECCPIMNWSDSSVVNSGTKSGIPIVIEGLPVVVGAVSVATLVVGVESVAAVVVVGAESGAAVVVAEVQSAAAPVVECFPTLMLKLTRLVYSGVTSGIEIVLISILVAPGVGSGTMVMGGAMTVETTVVGMMGAVCSGTSPLASLVS